MAIANTDKRWGWPAIALHWIIALLIIGSLGFGYYVANLLTDPTNPYADLTLKIELTGQHKTMGLVVFALVAVRLLWRLANCRSPRLPEGMTLIERAAAHASHSLLYVLMIAMPLTGWASASVGAEQMSVEVAVVMGVEIPQLLTAAQASSLLGALGGVDPLAGTPEQQVWPLMKTLHKYTAWALAALIALHVLAALKHAVINRDGVFRRMISMRGDD